jgi:tail tube protein
MAGDSQAIVTNGTTLLMGDGATPTEAFAKIAEVVTITPPTSSPAEVDVSHLESPAREKRAGLADTGSGEFQINFLPADPKHQQLFDEGNATVHPPHNWKVMFPPPNDTFGVAFRAAVGSCGLDQIGLDGAIRATVSLVAGASTRISGP